MSVDTLAAVIDIELTFSKEPDESNVEFPGDLHGKTRWSPNGCDHGKSSHQRFLQKFKAGASRQQKQTIPQRCAIRKEFGADELIHRIVAAYIFAKRQQIPG